MKSKLLLAIVLIIVSIMAITVMVSANGTGKEIIKTEDIIANFNGTDNSAYPLTGDDTIGVQFSLSADATYVGIGCPSWGDAVGELTFKMYKFNKDYDTTVKGTALVEKVFKNFHDNSFIGFEYTAADPLKAGEYLIVISDAFDEGGSGVGIWSHNKYGGQHFFEDGAYNKALSARMYVIFKGDTPATPFGTLTDPKELEESGVNKDAFPFLGALMRFYDPNAEYYFDMDSAAFIDEMTIKDGKLIVPVLAGNDPQFVVLLEPELEAPNVEEYPVMLIRMKREAESPKVGEIFFTTTDFAGPSAAGSVTFQYADTTEWCCEPS